VSWGVDSPLDVPEVSTCIDRCQRCHLQQAPNFDALQGPDCPPSCLDNSEQLLSFGGAAGARNFEESGRKWCSAVRGLDPDERKSHTLVPHSGQAMTYGYNTNHRAKNVRVHGTGTKIFWYADEYEKTTNRGMSPEHWSPTEDLHLTSPDYKTGAPLSVRDGQQLVGRVGNDPTTFRLKAGCSAN
jgi:hypothetical protein